MKPKKCKAKGCGVVFSPARPMQAVCSPLCAATYARAKTEQSRAKEARAQRVADKEKRDRLKSIKTIEDEVQQECNRYVRLRDAGKPCISCGTTTAEIYQAGHYLSRGAHPELRFELTNIHRQCVRCNMHQSGNQAAYRIGLVERIGIEAVEWLEGHHETRKRTREELAAMKKQFRQMCKELEKA